jgi:hypothetical protein
MVQKVFFDEAEPSNKLSFSEYSDTEFIVEFIGRSKDTTLVLDYNDLTEIIKELERIKENIKPF